MTVGNAIFVSIANPIEAPTVTARFDPERMVRAPFADTEAPIMAPSA